MWLLTITLHPVTTASWYLFFTHLRQPASDAKMTQPVDGVHHTTAFSPSTLSTIEVSSQHAHTTSMALHLVAPSAAGVSPELSLSGWVCSPVAGFWWLRCLQGIVDHHDTFQKVDVMTLKFNFPVDSPVEVVQMEMFIETWILSALTLSKLILSPLFLLLTSSCTLSLSSTSIHIHVRKPSVTFFIIAASYVSLTVFNFS